MKSQELRIGNFVMDTENYKDYSRFLVVIGLDPVNIYYRFSSEDIETELRITSHSGITEWDNPVFPIPLTPDILLNSGFTWDEIVYSKEYIWLAPGEGGYDIFLAGLYGGKKCTMRYVHQLQNLHYALLGEELKIVS